MTACGGDPMRDIASIGRRTRQEHGPTPTRSQRCCRRSARNSFPRLNCSMADSVYWTNYADNAIRGAPLAGGGAVETLYELAQGAVAPTGIAIYAAAGRVYWPTTGRCNSPHP